MEAVGAALTVGRIVVQTVAKVWLGIRRDEVQRDMELTDLIALRVTDRFHRRKLGRQLTDIGDHVAQRLRPLYETEFRDLPENERMAAMVAVMQSFDNVNLDDSTLLASNLDAGKIERLITAQNADVLRRAGLSEGARELYSIVLEECCNCLIRIVKQLPQFDSRAISELLTRISHVSDDIATLIERLPRSALLAPQGTAHDTEFAQRYLTHISVTLDELDIFGVDTHHYRPRTLVSVAYLSLEVSGGRPRRRQRRSEVPQACSVQETSTRASGERIESALAANPRMLVRGDAGSGKTTLLQWLAVNAARGSFGGELSKWNRLVPLIVKLRSYAGQDLPNVEEIIQGAAAPLSGIMPAGWVHRLLDAGNALLLVDGVDEVTAKKRLVVRNWLRNILAAYPRTQVVVTSRPGAANNTWLADDGFQSVWLEPMSPQDISAFTLRWHDAMRDAASRNAASLPCSPSDLVDYESSVLRQLEGHDHLQTLATNPLMCAMICALNLDRRKQLPPDRMRLYEQAIELLIDRRDSEREVPSAQTMALDVASKLAILQYFAWWLSVSGRAEIDIEDAVRVIQQAIQRMPHVDYDADAVLEYLLERSGIVREVVDKRVDFVHRTFQEYLTAKEIADSLPVEFIVKKAHLDQWRETTIMTAGHATKPFRNSLLDGLLERAESQQRHSRHLRLLAAACLELTRVVDENVSKRVETALAQVVPPRSIRECRSLTLAGRGVLRHLPASLSELNPGVAAACVRAASLIGGPEALAILEEYATDGRRRVQEQIIDGWNYFNPKEYAQRVLAHAPLIDGHIQVGRMSHISLLDLLSNIESVDLFLADGQQTNDISFLKNMPTVTALSIEFDLPLDLTPLLTQRHVTDLKLLGFPGSIRAEVLTELKEVESIALGWPVTDSDILPLPEMPRLSSVTLLQCQLLKDIAVVAQVPNLRTARFSQARLITQVDALSSLETLDDLGVRHAPLRGGLDSIVPLIDQLSVLDVAGCTSVNSIHQLRDSDLVDLILWGTSVSDIGAVASMRSLELLDLDGTLVEDISPVVYAGKLMILDLRDLADIDLSPLKDFQGPLEVFTSYGQVVHGLDQLGMRAYRRGRILYLKS